MVKQFLFLTFGFQNKWGFWAKAGEKNKIAKRIMEGRISVHREQVSEPSSTYSLFYFQKNKEPLKLLYESQFGELRQMLRDCPKAYEMIDISSDEYKKILYEKPLLCSSSY